MSSLAALLTLFLAFGFSIGRTAAAHAGFHIQYPWMTRSLDPTTRVDLEPYTPFCRDIIRNPQQYARLSRTFLSFCGHPGDLVTVLYTKNRVPRKKDDFSIVILQDEPVHPSGQLCVNVTIPFKTTTHEMGVMYFEARDPKTGEVQYHCSDVRMEDIEALPEEHPAMCAAGNETLIPMPDEYL